MVPEEQTWTRLYKCLIYEAYCLSDSQYKNMQTEKVDSISSDYQDHQKTYLLYSSSVSSDQSFHNYYFFFTIEGYFNFGFVFVF